MLLSSAVSPSSLRVGSATYSSASFSPLIRPPTPWGALRASVAAGADTCQRIEAAEMPTISNRVASNRIRVRLLVPSAPRNMLLVLLPLRTVGFRNTPILPQYRHAAHTRSRLSPRPVRYGEITRV